MSEVTANDRAFLAVSKELRRLQNDILVIDQALSFIQRLDHYSKPYLKEAKDAALYSPEVTSLAVGMSMMAGDGALLKRLQTKTKSRIKELETMSDQYLQGQDIIVSKLSRA